MSSDPFDDGFNGILSQVPEAKTSSHTFDIVDHSFDELPINPRPTKLEFDDDLDLVLSQIANEMEQEYQCTQSLSNMTISQCVADYLEPDDDLPNFFLEFDAEKDVDNDSDSAKKRFGEPATKTDIEKLINSQTNANTEKNTKWALEAFLKWRDTRNKDGENITLLKHMDAETMNTCLQRFVVEVRKQDGTEYPPKSLYYIVCGLLRHLRNEEIHDKNFLNENDIRFALFRKVLDAKMKELASRGVGRTVKQADPLSQEDEQKIWDCGVFGSDNSVSLQFTVFYYNCKLFGMRGYDEHRSLECEQFEIENDNKGKYIRFNGRTNKTFKGGLKQMKVQNKDIKHYCSNTEGSRCIADYYQRYLAAIGNRGYFYRRPLAGSSIRYGEQVLGVNKLKGLMKEITGKAGLQGNFTNHSGKRSLATQLYTAGIPEQEIMLRTGHRSEAAVRKYKRSSDKILQEVSDVLNPKIEKLEKSPKKMDVDTEVLNPKIEKLENSPMDVDTEVKQLPKLQGNPFSTAMKDITNFNNCTFNF